MSDTTLKVLASVAGFAGLGFVGAALSGTSERKANPLSEPDEYLSGDGDLDQEYEVEEEQDAGLVNALMDNKERFRSEFAAHAQEEGLPEPVGKELGCGGFGCVWKTTRDGWVMTATTDRTETRVATLLVNPNPPKAFVRYFRVRHYAGYDLLWREEVEPYVGDNLPTLDDYQIYAKAAHEMYDWAEYKDEWYELIDMLNEQMSDWSASLTTNAPGVVPVRVGKMVIDLSTWEPSED